jgi:RimJ/RimL family protein N-acetyltransferase
MEVVNTPERAEPGPTPRVGRAVKLLEVRPESTEFLYQLTIDESTGWRWRHGGSVPRRDTFEQNLWAGVLTQFVVAERVTNNPIGLVVAYNADVNHGFAYIGAAMVEGVRRSGAGFEAVALFSSHLFAVYRLRKLYFEVSEYNLPQFRSAVGTILKEEGVLRGHTYYRGQFWDRYILALYNEDFTDLHPVRNQNS